MQTSCNQLVLHKPCTAAALALLCCGCVLPGRPRKQQQPQPGPDDEPQLDVDDVMYGTEDMEGEEGLQVCGVQARRDFAVLEVQGLAGLLRAAAGQEEWRVSHTSWGMWKAEVVHGPPSVFGVNQAVKLTMQVPGTALLPPT